MAIGGYLKDDRSPLTPSDVAMMVYEESKGADGEADPQ